MKAGTRVKIKGHDWNGNETFEYAKVLRWHRVSGRREDWPAGYHRVKFESDGGVLMAHESMMRPA